MLAAVDAHHHLWDLQANHYPWLTPGEGPPPFPNFPLLCRNDLVEDFRADGARQAIVKSVHVQAEHDEADPVRETAWLQQVADTAGSGGFPHAIVAFADLTEPGVEAILEGHRRHRNTRGIRFPVDRLMIDYDTPWQVFREVVAIDSKDEQRGLLQGNAERIYRI